MKKLSFFALLLALLLTANCALAAEYTFDPATPYEHVISGLFNDVAITAAEGDAGVATIYLPEGLPPYVPGVMVLTPNGTTAAEFAQSELGQAWIATADANEIGLAFLAPAEAGWNLALDEAGRDDGAVVSQLFNTLRSIQLADVAPFTVDRSNISLVGYGEGGAAALLFGAEYATEFSSIIAVDAAAVSAEAFAVVGEQLVYPFPGDSTMGVEEMALQAKTVDMPVWFVNSAENNEAALAYYIAANEAVEAEGNAFAEAAYQSATSVAEIWVTDEAQTPESIYANFASAIKRFLALQEGGRLSAPSDFSAFVHSEEDVNGEPRKWMTYVPSSYDPQKETPLVLAIHGYTSSMYALAEESHWEDVAEENGFIVVYAQALVRDMPGMGVIPASTWVAGLLTYMFPHCVSVDVEFIDALLDKTIEAYNIDESRIYVTGHSNGAMMTWDLGVNLTERFAAMAPIGYQQAPMSAISSSALLPVWTMAGEFDSAATVLMQEGNSTVTALQAWNQHNGVNETAIAKSEQVDGRYLTMTFANADGVPMVNFTNVLGTPHVYMQEQAVVLWNDFFSKYSRGEDGTLYYEGEAVNAGEYVASAEWYTPAAQ